MGTWKADREVIRKYNRDWYHKNKKSIISARKVRVNKVRKALDEWKEQTPCADCGKKFPSVCMDFDHLRDKKGNISDLVYGEYGDTFLRELEKCELVCACCHRLRTQNRFKDKKG